MLICRILHQLPTQVGFLVEPMRAIVKVATVFVFRLGVTQFGRAFKKIACLELIHADQIAGIVANTEGI